MRKKLDAIKVIPYQLPLTINLRAGPHHRGRINAHNTDSDSALIPIESDTNYTLSSSLLILRAHERPTSRCAYARPHLKTA